MTDPTIPRDWPIIIDASDLSITVLAILVAALIAKALVP